jgi:hypothetical protein
VTAPRTPTERYDASDVRFYTLCTGTFFLLGLGFVGLTAGWLVLDWHLSGRVLAAAIGGVVCGYLCWLCARLRKDAVEDLPDEVYEAVERRAWEWGGGPS